MTHREEEVICHHREDINSSTHIGTCRICGQQRQYDEGDMNPRVIRRGMINSFLTMVSPPHFYPEEKKETPMVTAKEEPPTGVKPKNWGSMHNHEKKRWYLKHKKQILEDLKTTGLQATRKKWGIPPGTWSNFQNKWPELRDFNPLEVSTPKQPKPAKEEPKPELIPEPTPEPTTWPPPMRTPRTGMRGVRGF